ncbi:hypothetical protein CIHG_04716 [Coccidioides immitis H538.4]|uniref:Uncharacterized protein n=3 Tax=Coccidioides immitis TaxID=5501 RepID=A0A0J8QIU6_COCIT|nr:hypothetical protein CIRG_08136 [Coccidioides immitis RMSCC 2394]KMU72289.1 hypothetical protein CISG_02938 [Coccidioides immitis RMSCC 3703]KMU87271.1 hypothetical protein CIHG_04716 [Coccidioides immitis H538.4]
MHLDETRTFSAGDEASLATKMASTKLKALCHLPRLAPRRLSWLGESLFNILLCQHRYIRPDAGSPIDNWLVAPARLLQIELPGILIVHDRPNQITREDRPRLSNKPPIQDDPRSDHSIRDLPTDFHFCCNWQLGFMAPFCLVRSEIARIRKLFGEARIIETIPSSPLK